jgi:hypothetical protein
LLMITRVWYLILRIRMETNWQWLIYDFPII